MVDYIVMYSGGITSFEAARRTIEKYGSDSVRLWFADTMIEDEDLYRFNQDIEKLLGVEIEVISDGKSVWDIFFDLRMMGNSRIDPCSRVLKREALRKKLKAEYPNPEDAIVVLGMDDIEDCNRWKRAGESQAPYSVYFPLMDGKRITKRGIMSWLKENGIQPPRLYDLGFKHNNCGGFCVKAGLGQFAHLHKTMPERYAEHENKEERFREMVGKNVSILRDRRNNESKPMTMRELRKRIEAGEVFPYDSDWSCMCFIETRLEDWFV
tara:strand:+ start:2450 stop:3250 length:801 start_codon:yes stop_codon:yes gene_type:complete